MPKQLSNAHRNLALFLCAFASFSAPAAHATDQEPLAFVQQFVAATASLERVRARAEDQLRRTPKTPNDTLADCIRISTSFEIELRMRAYIFGDIRLVGTNPQFSDLPLQIAQLYRRRQTDYQALREGCSAMLRGPKPGVDYGELAVAAPQITARLDASDQLLLQTVMPMVFFTLVSDQPDNDNHINHLRITRAQKTALLNMIEVDFGASLNEESQSPGASIGTVLRNRLSAFKAVDDPW